MVVVATIVAINKVGQGVILITITSLKIPHIRTTVNICMVLKFFIVIYVPNTIYTLKPHYKFLKTVSQFFLFIGIVLFVMPYYNTTLHAYTIDLCCYCWVIVYQMCYCFVNKIEDNQ